MSVKYDYERIVQGILDIGEAMIRCGAENFRLQDSLYRICRSYGFVKYDIFVIPSNIQITAETPEGQIITQIRLVEIGECDFDKLDYLNNLCRKVCKEKPDAKEMRRQFEEVMGRPEQKWYTHYAAGILGGTGFAVFFGCNIRDAIIAVIVSIVIVAAGNWLAEREKNLLAYNLILSFIAEMIILLSVKFGFADHEERIMIGIVMLLISGLSTTNGIRDLLQKDFISGSINIMNSMLGASAARAGAAGPTLGQNDAGGQGAQRTVLHILLHGLMDFLRAGSNVRVLQINLRQGQTQGRGGVTDGLISLGPVVRLRSVLVAGDDCPLGQVHAFTRKHDLGNTSAAISHNYPSSSRSSVECLYYSRQISSTALVFQK